MTTPRYVGGALDLSSLVPPAGQAGPAGPAASSTAGAQAASASGRSGAPSGSGASMPVLTDATFEQVVAHGSQAGPVVVLIGTDRSPQSVQLRTDLSELCERYEVSATYIDADATPHLAQAFGISGLPTTVAVFQAKPVTHFEGGQARADVEQWVRTLKEKLGGGLPEGLAEEEQGDPRLAVAEAALEAGDFAGALAAYDEVLAADPNAKEIKQARATVVLLQRLNTEQESELFRQADTLVIQDDATAAFDLLLDAMKQAEGDEKAEIRARLFELFGIFEPGDKRVLAARTALANSLY